MEYLSCAEPVLHGYVSGSRDTCFNQYFAIEFHKRIYVVLKVNI